VAQLLKLILLQGGKIMGLPLLAKVGEERELTEEISIYDILDILDFAELGKDVADLTTEYLKAAFLAYAKTIAKVSNVVVGISIAAYVLEAILIGLQRNGKTALEVTYTYRYDLLYGDPTTVPRWQATGFSYRFV
jgi:hypothetical protein